MNNNRHFAHTPCAGPTGVDKLILTTRDYVIADASKTGLQIKHGFTDLATGERNESFLFKDKAGTMVSGSSAFMNCETYGVNINSFGLQIVFNPSKAYHPYELCSDNDKLQERTKQLFKDIASRGIRADFEQMRISRIDLARNAELEQPCIAYAPVFSWLNIPRAKRAARYPDGHTSNNNRFGINLYNKGKELREGGIDLISHDRMLRAELQYKGTQSVCKRTGIGNVASLFEAGTAPLHALYVETLSQDIFKAGASNQPQIVYGDIKQFIVELRKQYGDNRAMNIFYSTYGIQTLINDLGSIQHFEKILQDIGYHRNSIGKHKNRIMEYLNIQKKISKGSGTGKLFKELLYKLAA